MKTIELRHDQAWKATTVHVGGEPISLNCLGTGQGHSVPDWKDRLFSELTKVCRLGPGLGGELLFWGMEDDFGHIKNAMEDYRGSHPDIEITLSHKGEIPAAAVCRNCGYELKPHWIKCPKCKTSVEEEALVCGCGEKLEEWMDECPACGKPVSKATGGGAERGLYGGA
jgi:hypothetical protein